MGATAGDSGTPLPRKLGIKGGIRLALLGAPPHFADLLRPLPEAVRPRTDLRGGCDLAIAFFTERARLRRCLPALRAAIYPDGAIWIAWPKRAARVPTDITEDAVRELALARGLVDIKVAAIDATWSGLRLVVPRAQRGVR